MKMKKIFAAMFLLLVAFSTSMTMAQQMPPIPVDDAVKIGKLDNGLTYYIRQNNYPENRVYFYIAQRVGAMQEEDSQNGLAHFLEHMAFNGSENFNGEGKSIIDYTRSLGVNYGGDLNAGTWYTFTVYMIENVPSTRQSAIDSCLLILKDWSHGLLLTDKEIDKERGVIHEEWRLRLSPDQRMENRQRETLFPGSKYAKRNVIGDMDVVDNFPYQVLRDYYDKWYRPDNQALVIVGDVDVDHIESTIKQLFKDIPAPGPNAAQVEDYPVPDNAEPIVAIDKDKEQPYSITRVMFKHDIIEKQDKATVDYLIIDYMKDMMSSMLNERLAEKAQEEDCPFLQGVAYDGQYMNANTKDAFNLITLPKEGMVEAATQAALIEALRAAKYGFTATEYARAQEEYLSQLERRYNERDKIASSRLAEQYYNNFLDNEPIPSIEQEYQLMNMIAPNISVEDINGLLPEFIDTSGKNLVVLNYNQEKDGAVYPTSEGLLAAIKAAEEAKIEAYVDNVKQEPLMATMPKKGKIVKESENTTFGYKVLELSNGARAILKKTDFKQDEIRMSAFKRGGKSLYGENDWANLQMVDADALRQVTGLGSFSNSELDKALAGKQVNVSMGLSDVTDALSGFSTVKDLETMFQLIHLNFTALSKDEKKFNQQMKLSETILKNKEFQPEAAFNDTIQYLVGNRNWRNKPMSADDLKLINYDRVMEIVKERTANAADFTFTFVGSFDETLIRQYIEQYIASLPGKKGVKTNWNNDVEMPKGETVCHFTHKMETPQHFEIVIWHDSSLPYNLETAVKANILGEVLTKIYDLKIREEAGATYAAYAYGANGRSGDKTNTIVMAVSPVKPEFRDEALKIMNDEMVNACSNIDASTLKDIQENMLKEHATNLKENGYWMGVIQDYLLYGNDRMSAYDDIVKAQTPETIAAFARQLTAAGNRIEVVMSPEE